MRLLFASNVRVRVRVRVHVHVCAFVHVAGQGSTIAELQKSGSVLGHWGASCGRLEGFDYNMLQVGTHVLSARVVALLGACVRTRK